ncbi:MAG: hypothetical protein ACFFDH_00235 [Promethearchaeota archaeon]
MKKKKEKLKINIPDLKKSNVKLDSDNILELRLDSVTYTGHGCFYTKEGEYSAYCRWKPNIDDHLTKLDYEQILGILDNNGIRIIEEYWSIRDDGTKILKANFRGLIGTVRYSKAELRESRRSSRVQRVPYPRLSVYNPVSPVSIVFLPILAILISLIALLFVMLRFFLS